MSNDAPVRLSQAFVAARDHVRGSTGPDAVMVVAYLDFLCPYCRRLRPVFARLRETLGDGLAYVFRAFPIERAHPGAELVARAAEAAGRQGRFFQMHDWLFDHELPIGRDDLFAAARELELDLDRFTEDLESDEVRARVDADLASGRASGVTGTPTMFVDGVRYDGAWEYHSMLEGIERPIAARVSRSARVFASLPTSAGIVLLCAAALAIVLANSPLGSLYERAMNAEIAVGPIDHAIVLSTRDWLAEGLLAFFFLIVGLEIRRELTSGGLGGRAAVLPVVAALGGVVAPALIYLAFNRGRTSAGWAIPTATDVAFALALLAVLGDRVPTSLRVFVAALAVVDDLISIVTIAIVYPETFAPIYAIAVVGCVVAVAVLNRWRVYASWPYVFVGIALWVSLHLLGVHAALTGVVLALCIPTRPSPSPAPLLAQAATALAALDAADREAERAGRESRLEEEPVWDWAARNLFATTERLLSPADRIARAVAPWSTFLVLPLFAFSATGVSFAIDLSSADSRSILIGTIAGLVIGKPLGIVAASLLARATGIARFPPGIAVGQLVGAACLCGVGDTMALLMADRAFGAEAAGVAKLGVLAGSTLAGLLGVAVLYSRFLGPRRART